MMLVADAGPLLVTVIVKVTSLPTLTLAAEAVLVSTKSAGSRTVDVTEAVLFAGARSGWVAATVTVLVNEPACVGVTTSVREFWDGEAIDPKLQVTVAVPAQV